MNMKLSYGYKAILAIICLLTFSAASTSQVTQIKRYMVVRSAPAYTFQVNINYNQSLLELSGTYNDDFQSVNVYNGQTFGADKGYGASLTSKISLDERSTVRFIQTLVYNRILSYTFGDKTTVADNGKSTFNCFTGGLGMEYNFTPAHRFKIYIGAELNASLISGNSKIWFENRTNPPPTDSTYSIKSSLRMGYGLIMGSEYLLNNNFGLNVGVKLTNANAFLKKSEGTNSDTEFSLRDADDPNLKFAGKKSFSFYSITAGINFYFGVKEKRYKLN
jgi:hypothetical protein